MPDEITYDSEMNQPAHRPGMEGPANRTPAKTPPPSDDLRDVSGNRVGDRRTVSPAARSAFGRDSLSAPAPKAAPPKPGPAPERDSYSGFGGRAREQAIDDEVKKMGG